MRKVFDLGKIGPGLPGVVPPDFPNISVLTISGNPKFPSVKKKRFFWGASGMEKEVQLPKRATDGATSGSGCCVRIWRTACFERLLETVLWHPLYPVKERQPVVVCQVRANGTKATWAVLVTSLGPVAVIQVFDNIESVVDKTCDGHEHSFLTNRLVSVLNASQ